MNDADDASLEPKKIEETPRIGSATEGTNQSITQGANQGTGLGANRRVEDADRDLTFDKIKDKYQEKIYNLILRMVGNPDDAEDLTIETFLNAWRAWERFRGEARVSTWLHQIAYNNCKNFYKQRDRQRDREAMSLDDNIDTDSGSGDVSREIPDWSAAPERVFLNQELVLLIQKYIADLQPDYRVVLLLSLKDDMSYEEIAQVTGLTVPAVKTRLHRARQKMQQRLAPYYKG
jgi:RNA polymerase sigma-70 factor, ECF subfamily